MPRGVDWKIGARQRINRSPELRAETIEGIRELLATGDSEDRMVARGMARDLLGLEFAGDVELLAQLRQAVAV